MDKDFTSTDNELYMAVGTKISIYYKQQFIDFLRDNLPLYGNILDIGDRNPLTERLEKEFNVNIDSTSGDLDELLVCKAKQYDIVICSQVIEHVFNPLFLLLNIKSVMKDRAALILATPMKPYWITQSTRHFHEMDKYRLYKLIKRAGFTIQYSK